MSQILDSNPVKNAVMLSYYNCIIMQKNDLNVKLHVHIVFFSFFISWNWDCNHVALGRCNVDVFTEVDGTYSEPVENKS